MNLRLIHGRKFFQKLSVVREPHIGVGCDPFQRIGQRHIAMAMMMSVAFAVGCDVNELPRLAILTVRVQQSLCQASTIVQQPFKGHSARNRPIVEKYGNTASFRRAYKIRTCRIHTGVRRLMPGGGLRIVLRGNCPHPRTLVRGQNGEADSMLRQQIEAFQVYRCLGQPHAFRFASKAVLKVGDAPSDLRNAVLRVRKRKNNVVVYLRYRRAVPTEALRAGAVCIQ